MRDVGADVYEARCAREVPSHRRSPQDASGGPDTRMKLYSTQDLTSGTPSVELMADLGSGCGLRRGRRPQ